MFAIKVPMSAVVLPNR